MRDLVLGKSAIHDWGVFNGGFQSIPANQIVIECLAGMLTQGGREGRQALLASRLHSIPPHFPIFCMGSDGSSLAPPPRLTGSYHPRYVGEVIRSAVSDIREREYNAQGKEMYMFSTGDGEIIDATMKGNMARAMNHSCDVSAPDLRKQ